MVTVTDVRMRVLDESEERKIKAISSVTFNDSFVIHDVKVLDSEKGLYVVMPSKKAPDGTFKDIAHPLNTETRQMIQEKVLAEYEKATS
jgi:stage V sporulation protein G